MRLYLAGCLYVRRVDPQAAGLELDSHTFDATQDDTTLKL